jgi:ribosomal protein S27E
VAAHDAGVEVTCPACGQVVLQKAMIPVLADGGPGGPGGHDGHDGVRYLCASCARALVVIPSGPGADPVPEPEDDDAGGSA